MALLVVTGALAVASVALRGQGAAPDDASADLGEEVGRSVGEWVGDGDASSLAEGLIGASERTSRTSDLALADEASRILEDYERRGNCVVAQAGYLDLSGRTWGCVMQGVGWVEICVVTEGTSGKSSVEVWHMDAADVEGLV